MKSITIHKIDDELARVLSSKARQAGTSLNRTVKSLLRSSLGLKPRVPVDHREEFLDQYGTWTEKEASDFNDRVSELEQVDKADWKTV